MKKSVCLSQDSNLGSLIYLYGLIQPIRGRNRVKQNIDRHFQRTVENKKFVDITRQCFASLPEVNFLQII